MKRFILVCCSISISIGTVYGPNALASPLNCSEKLPDIEIISAKGRSPERLSRLITQPSVLAFWASWCAPCIYELLSLKQFLPNLPAGTRIIAVSIDKDPMSAKTFARGFAPPLELFFDYNGSSERSLRINSLPLLYVVGPKLKGANKLAHKELSLKQVQTALLECGADELPEGLDQAAFRR